MSVPWRERPTGPPGMSRGDPARLRPERRRALRTRRRGVAAELLWSRAVRLPRVGDTPTRVLPLRTPPRREVFLRASGFSALNFLAKFYVSCPNSF